MLSVLHYLSLYSLLHVTAKASSDDSCPEKKKRVITKEDISLIVTLTQRQMYVLLNQA